MQGCVWICLCLYFWESWKLLFVSSLSLFPSKIHLKILFLYPKGQSRMTTEVIGMLFSVSTFLLPLILKEYTSITIHTLNEGLSVTGKTPMQMWENRRRRRNHFVTDRHNNTGAQYCVQPGWFVFYSVGDNILIQYISL